MVEDINNLEERADRIEEFEGEHEVPLIELFSPDFMQKYTEFESFEELFEESPWTVESEEDLDNIPDEPFDDYIDEHTVFKDHIEMMNKASDEWIAKQLGL